jgi:hypothetical protein
MIRAVPRLAPILVLLILVHACSGPSAPSPATSANAPAAAAAPATAAPEPGAPASVAASGGFEFLGSDPGPGSETWVTESIGEQLSLRDLTVRVAVHFNQSVPDGAVVVKLFGDTGRLCAGAFVAQPIAPGHVYRVSEPFWFWDTQACSNFPVTTVTLSATLLNFRTDIEYLTQTFPVRYTIRRYRPPPPNAPQTPPTISALDWRAIGPSGGDWPLPGDPITFGCAAKETDGAPVTVQITQKWDGLAPIVHTKAFQAEASSSPGGARFEVGRGTPNTAPAPRATIECVVTNDRGQHDVKTLNIGPPR